MNSQYRRKGWKINQRKVNGRLLEQIGHDKLWHKDGISRQKKIYVFPSKKEKRCYLLQQAIKFLLFFIDRVTTYAPQSDNLVNNIIVQLLGHVWLFATSWTTACQASLPFTIWGSLLWFMFIQLVMLSNHLIFCHPPPSLPLAFNLSQPGLF